MKSKNVMRKYLDEHPAFREQVRRETQEQVRLARARDAAEARAKKIAQPAAAHEEPGAYGPKP